MGKKWPKVRIEIRMPFDSVMVMRCQNWHRPADIKHEFKLNFCCIFTFAYANQIKLDAANRLFSRFETDFIHVSLRFIQFAL